MAESIQVKKQRHKPLRALQKGQNIEDKSISSYYYPKNNLYTRQEFELLDTIYSDGPQNTYENIEKELSHDFWPQNKEEYLKFSNKKSNFLTKLTYFTAGVMLTSAIWLIYFQVNLNERTAKDNTRIVFHKTAQILTHKTVDKEITRKLADSKVSARSSKFNFSKWFSNKPKKVGATLATSNPVPSKFHTVSSGDSLWVIANKYYSNPSPDNIIKIAKANNLKTSSVLQAGQKLVVPE